MRIAVLLVLSLATLAQEAAKPTHDKLGFPITFNTDRITRSDVLRSMGSPEDPDDGSVASARDKLLMDKITQHMASIWGIRVLEADVDREIRREIKHRGGEAKFHGFLGQRGDTLARYRQEKRLQLVRFHINYLLANGISLPPGQKVLPWSTRPSPDEVRVAIRQDSERLSKLGPRVRGLWVSLKVDTATRQQVVRRVMKNRKLKLADELARHADELAEAVVKRLDGGESFQSVVDSFGKEVGAQPKLWISLPGEPSNDPVLRFFQTGKPKSYSKSLAYPGGIRKIAYLIERALPGGASKMTPELYDNYVGRIAGLRRQKVKALMRLQALDRSSVGPDFLRKQFRADLVADLKASITELKALGLR